MLPNYDRSILSITASIMDYYGLQPAYPVLDELTQALTEKQTKKIVLLLLDGMGENLLKRRLPADAFLNVHDACAISTVYPSTTTAATTSLWTGKSPIEHGWLGWSLYFKECGRQIDAFLDRDSFSNERYPFASPAGTFMPLTPIYAALHGKTETHTLFPFKTNAANGAEFPHIYSGVADCMRLIGSIVREDGDKLICAYINEPDHSMHQTGVASEKTQSAFEMLNRYVEALAGSLPEDALLIVTADHGLVDMHECVKINEYPEIDECLIMPPSIESRAATFFVKPHRKADFEKAFQAVCGAYFQLYTREEVLNMNLLGRGTPHKKVDDFLGDYLACATGDRFICYMTPAGKEMDLIGQHAGLTEDEMTVPVILYRGGKR